MAFDYKKEYKEFYLPKSKPSIIEIPKMNYLAVRGKGNPNTENGEYKESIGLLYGIAYTLKMSYKGPYKIDGYFEYIVPPLEGFWWQEGIKGMDYNRKDDLNFISLIRLPDFITKKDFLWAIEEATKKKKQDFSKVEFLTYDEGLCVQCMHIGSYDNEPQTVELMHQYLIENNYELDITDTRYHHEIYLSDPRKCEINKLKTVIRHPIKNVNRGDQMQLSDIDQKIHKCNLCGDMVEKFPNSKTVSIGKRNDIVILGEAPANNGWRKSGIAWYDTNHKLLPSGVVLEKLLNIINLKIEDTHFLEAIKCFPKDRKYLNKCNNNCKKYLLEQLEIIKPKVILSLGDSATRSILDFKYKKFSDVVGKEFFINGIKVIPIYHPSPISPMSYKGNIEIFNNLKI